MIIAVGGGADRSHISTKKGTRPDPHADIWVPSAQAAQ
jgi:hypothetical protein